MLREELLAYQDRWKLVEAREVQELRSATLEHKLQQVAALMASVDAFGWREGLADDQPVWELWQKLRAKLSDR
jgi:hypothetical protein